MKTRTKGEPIPVDERDLAAKYLTTENLGWKVADDGTGLEGVKASFRDCREAFGAEGLEVGEELEDWRREVRKSGFHADEWNLEILPRLVRGSESRSDLPGSRGSV